MLPIPKGKGLLVRPRRYPRESPKGLPGPLDISGRVLIAVYDEAAVGTDVGAYAQALEYTFATPTAVLRGEHGWHGEHSTASVHCFAFEDGPELRPARTADALGQVRVAEHVGHPQVFELDRVVGAEQRACGLMVEVTPLTGNLLMSARDSSGGAGL